MLTLHVKCSHCSYEAWIPMSAWDTLCPKCFQHGVYKIETKAQPPRIGATNGEDDNSKG